MRKMKVVIWDKGKDTIEDIRYFLKQNQPDYDLLVTNSKEECLDILKNGDCPDAIVLGMPKIDVSKLNAIKQIRDESDIPIVVLSKDKSISTLVKVFDSGANDYMTIPFKQLIFATKLNALIRRRNWDIQANKEAWSKL